MILERSERRAGEPDFIRRFNFRYIASVVRDVAEEGELFCDEDEIPRSRSG